MNVEDYHQAKDLVKKNRGKVEGRKQNIKVNTEPDSDLKRKKI